MKVLNVDVTIDTVAGGGCAERAFQMNRALTAKGVKCTAFIIDIGLFDDRINKLHGAHVYVNPCLSRRFYVPRVSIRRLKKMVSDVDIMHLMPHWTFSNALIYLMARYYRKPYVICPAGSLPVDGRSSSLKRIYNRIIGNKIIRNADAVIAISRDEFSHFREYGVKSSRMKWIPNGIKPEDYMESDPNAFRKAYKLPQNPFILFVGRLAPIKGPDLLLEAFSNLNNRFSNYHLVFAGPDDGMQGALENYAQDLGVKDRIHFLGFLSGIKKSWAFHASDLLVIPSRREAMSIVVLEAGTTGTPVLATDQCGLSEIETIGGGMVVPASINGIHSGLEKILSKHDNFPAMGARLKQFVHERFIWDSISEKYINLYREILAKTE
jgi:glycosyltransferase involved in cell wall biosynthesis